ncbi:MAG: glycosyltransferase domain-containing protein [Bacteroidota bacterium]
MSLHIAAFTSADQPMADALKSYADSQKVSLTEVSMGDTMGTEKQRIQRLDQRLGEAGLAADDLLLVVNGQGTYLTGTKEEITKRFNQQEADVLFAADANFRYPEGPLQYYHWKFYPRWHKYYNYLNADAFMGKVSVIQKLLQDISAHYHFDTNEVNPKDWYFTRYYLDQSLDIVNPTYQIDVDGNQEILAGTGGSVGAVKWPFVNWVEDHFLHLHEETLVEKSASFRQSKVRGLAKNGESFRNRRTKTNPLVVSVPLDKAADVDFVKGVGLGSWFKSLWAWIRAVGQFKIVFVVNRFSINPHHMFRFEKHKNPDYEATMQQFLGYLDRGEAFTFAHFNDGELNFIRKFLAGDHKKTWNGRIQDQYDVPLAERLLDSIKYQQDNYFIGVSCSTCAAPRRKIADELMGEYRGKVGAMVFHHNLRYLPKIISQMVHREMFYVMNDYQKLDILENLGVTVKEENKIKIPFVNSHKEYDNLKDKQFPDGSFVILMCGMLAKILIRNWYELNPTVTFIALGSTMDDFIQLSNTNYSPYPNKTLPLTLNIHLITSFLFGKKKQCVECYNI